MLRNRFNSRRYDHGRLLTGKNMIKLGNIPALLSHALNPNSFRVMLKKAWKHLDRRGQADSGLEAWIREHAVDLEAFCIAVDAELWRESVQFQQELDARARKTLESVDFKMGGGGASSFLYFVTRLLKPAVIVETGVAAGFSSTSFLTAIERNGAGRLYSSDFPYVRIKNSADYIGVVVDEGLRKNWELLIEGDEKNLSEIVGKCGPIDVFHYDSDKTYSGREMALAVVSPNFTEQTLIMFDDIQDNAHFKDLVASRDRKDWFLFEFGGKYIGVIGTLA